MNFKVSKQESSLEKTQTDSGNMSSNALKHKRERKSNAENANCGALSSLVVATPVCSVRVTFCASGLHVVDLFNEGALPEQSSDEQYALVLFSHWEFVCSKFYASNRYKSIYIVGFATFSWRTRNGTLKWTALQPKPAAIHGTQIRLTWYASGYGASLVWSRKLLNKVQLQCLRSVLHFGNLVCCINLKIFFIRVNLLSQFLNCVFFHLYSISKTGSPAQ